MSAMPMDKISDIVIGILTEIRLRTWIWTRIGLGFGTPFTTFIFQFVSYANIHKSWNAQILIFLTMFRFINMCMHVYDC